MKTLLLAGAMALGLIETAAADDAAAYTERLCADRFPTDYRMQVDCFNQQVAGVHRNTAFLKRYGLAYVTKDEYAAMARRKEPAALIWSVCTDRFWEDDNKIADCVEEQEQAAIAMGKLSPPKTQPRTAATGEIEDDAQRLCTFRYPDEPDDRAFCVTMQTQAALKNNAWLKRHGITPENFDEMVKGNGVPIRIWMFCTDLWPDELERLAYCLSGQEKIAIARGQLAPPKYKILTEHPSPYEECRSKMPNVLLETKVPLESVIVRKRTSTATVLAWPSSEGGLLILSCKDGRATLAKEW